MSATYDTSRHLDEIPGLRPDPALTPVAPVDDRLRQVGGEVGVGRGSTAARAPQGMPHRRRGRKANPMPCTPDDAAALLRTPDRRWNHSAEHFGVNAEGRARGGLQPVSVWAWSWLASAAFRVPHPGPGPRTSESVVRGSRTQPACAAELLKHVLLPPVTSNCQPLISMASVGVELPTTVLVIDEDVPPSDRLQAPCPVDTFGPRRWMTSRRAFAARTWH